MKSQEHPLILKAVYSYVLSLLFSILLIPLFSEFYELIFTPPLVRYGWFYNRSQELVIGAIIFSYIFLLSLFIFLLIPRKKWLVWLIGIIIPFLFLLRAGWKEVLWLIILTIIGALIGWLIKYIYKKLKK